MKVFSGSGNGIRILRELAKAEYSIKILCYLLLSPRVHSKSGITTNFIEILNQKIAEGVTVQILCNDKYPTGWLKKRLEIERYRLRRIGAIVRTYPRTTLMHSKLVLIDERHCFTGSMNLTAESMNKNHEILLHINEPIVVNQFEEIFKTAWKETKTKKENKKA